MVPVVYDASYDRYFFGPSHPFSPVRQHMLLDLLGRLGASPPIVRPDPATPDVILRVHAPSFVEQVEAAAAGRPLPDAFHYGLGTPDVPIFDGMEEAARILVGGTVHAARMIEQGQARVVLQLGGGLHHARRATASGFCVYNDLSCAIRHFRDLGWRVAYLDIDVHHGDGVQEIHCTDRDTLTISVHESGRYLYPGTGFAHEIGEEDGRGYALNIPLEPGTTNDSFLECVERVVPHALMWFQPDVLIVQCGADAHFRDPLADLLLTTQGYERLFRLVINIARHCAGGRALLTLGGGYDLDATARIWTILYLVVNDLPLPHHLPAGYLDRWKEKGVAVSSTLHDPDISFEIDAAHSIENQNRLVSKRVLELVTPHWY